MLRLTILLQVSVAVLDFVCFSKYSLEGFFGILFAILLFMAQRQLSFQVLTMYNFFCIYFAVRFCVVFLVPVQNGDDLSTYSSFGKFEYAVAVISCAYYIYAFIFCFFPYREFKAITYREIPAYRGAASADEFVNQPEQPQERQKKNFEVFKGEGIRIG